LVIRHNGDIVAQMPSHLVANAPLANLNLKRPKYIDELKSVKKPKAPADLTKVLLSLLSNPTIASKQWVFQQYDHEVGLRTVVKPGAGDAAVLRLDNGNFVTIKLDGNSKHCYLDPYQGTLGCLSEGRRNVICTGGEPVGVVDHLQFASPEDPEVYWTFKQAVDAIIDFCAFMKIPVVGGKVSFYNETVKGPIKPTPVMGMVGLVSDVSNIMRSGLHSGDTIFIVGRTSGEMGGSEYYEYFHNITGGLVPKVNLKIDNQVGNAVLKLIKSGLVNCAHDCSKGGLAVALAEMAISGSTGLTIELGAMPTSCSRIDDLLFSESQSRYLLGTRYPADVRRLLSSEDILFAEIGNANGNRIEFKKGKKVVIRLNVKTAEAAYNSLERRMYQ
jgi:phosphoribosylformylglycinamidine synthase subunit PurL